MRSVALGIDLGTTHSVVACLDGEGRPGTVTNCEGELKTPSAVFFDERSLVVGREALKAIEDEPERVARWVKRDMGRQLSRGKFAGRQFPPEVIQALVLRKLKADAELKLGEVRQAVITVPAFFDEPRRKATQDAGRLAGLDVLDIINEPTAAAISYGVQRRFLNASGESGQKETILVYDLGGGTFDATLMQIDGDQYRTLATAGDVFLGGVDWDQRLADYLGQQFAAEHGPEILNDECALQSLLTEAEDAKHTLTAREETSVRVVFQGKKLRIPVSREKFEELTADLLERTRFTVRKVLREAGARWNEITRLLVVGGSSRMPAVQKMLEQESGLPVDRSLSPDEAVAHGAAVYAGLLTRHTSERIQGVSVSNVNSHDLGVVGVERASGRKRRHVMIRRNTPLPASNASHFTTWEDSQPDVAVNIVEGGDTAGDHATPIGCCLVSDLPNGLPKGTPVVVHFEYASNGRLTVRAELPDIDQQATVVVERAAGLSEEEIETWRNRVAAGALFEPAKNGHPRNRSRDSQKATVGGEQPGAKESAAVTATTTPPPLPDRPADRAPIAAALPIAVAAPAANGNGSPPPARPSRNGDRPTPAADPRGKTPPEPAAREDRAVPPIILEDAPSPPPLAPRGAVPPPIQPAPVKIDQGDYDEEEPAGIVTPQQVASVFAFSLVLHLVVLLPLAFVWIAVEAGDPLLGILGSVPDSTPPELQVDKVVVEKPEDVEENQIETQIVTDLVAKDNAVVDVDLEPPSAPATDPNANGAAAAGPNGPTHGRSKGARQALLTRYGGTKESESAVRAGLEWLARHQRSDGGWNFDHQIGLCDCKNPGSFKKTRMAATAMALLCFLGAGHTFSKGDFKHNVQRGLGFLLKEGKRSPTGGDFRGAIDGNAGMYTQGLVSIVLCEAVAMNEAERKSELRSARSRSKAKPSISPAKRMQISRQLFAAAKGSAYFIVNAQSSNGGWRYKPRSGADTSVVGWQIMALASAHSAGIRIHPRVIAAASAYLDSVGTYRGGRYGYTSSRSPSPAMTAVGLLCRIYMGWKRNNPGIQMGVNRLSSVGPSRNNMYYNYYATQVMHQYGGKLWTKWNDVMRDQLVDSQVKVKGHARGSWDPTDRHHGPGGRLYQTCLSILTLEVYYRHLPMYDHRNLDKNDGDAGFAEREFKSPRKRPQKRKKPRAKKKAGT